MSTTWVYCTPPYNALADRLAYAGGFHRGVLSIDRYGNGELNAALPNKEEVRGQSVIILTTTDFADLALGRYITRRLAEVADFVSLHIPYFSYSTQEQEDTPGRLILAEDICDDLSGLPRAGIRTSVVLTEIHNPVMLSMIDRTRVAREHLRAEQFLATVVERILSEKCGGLTDQAVLVTGDSNKHRLELVKALAEKLQMEHAFVNAHRISPTEKTTEGRIVGNVGGKIAIIVDDIFRSLGTMRNAGKTCKLEGAVQCIGLGLHPDFTERSIVDTMADPNQSIDCLYVSDTYPSRVALPEPFVTTVSFADFMADWYINTMRFPTSR